MEKKQLNEIMNSIKGEYRKLANYDLSMIFIICLVLWASILGQIWLSFGFIMILTICVYLRFNYMKKLFKEDEKY